ncbi:MAG TPA: DNA recombination protein RmuC [Candidatus Binatia bacterium]
MSINEILPSLTAFLLLTNVVLLLIIMWLSGSAAQQSERSVREELRISRAESARADKDLREEVTNGLNSVSDSMVRVINEIGSQQSVQLDAVSKLLSEITDTHAAHIEELCETVDTQLRELQDSNERKLEEMRETVDEKLHGTIERRLGESFKMLSDRLDAVHNGLGEMHDLATGVGDLKRVLTGVETRGNWGEFQLEALLKQLLTPNQYDKNIATKDGSKDTVEYAIRLPGPGNPKDGWVWLPIDSKFPEEEYRKLQEAAEKTDSEAVKKALSNLTEAIRKSAKNMHERYLNPPKTTDFGILFLPVEGLYAEVLRQPALVNDLQQNHRVVVAGPTTLAAILNSLRIGFRTLMIEERAREVWNVLAAVKTEFSQFGTVLDKLKQQLSSATTTIEETGARTRAMERHLGDVEELTTEAAAEVLKLNGTHRANGTAAPGPNGAHTAQRKEGAEKA